MIVWLLSQFIIPTEGSVALLALTIAIPPVVCHRTKANSSNCQGLASTAPPLFHMQAKLQENRRTQSSIVGSATNVGLGTPALWKSGSFFNHYLSHFDRVFQRWDQYELAVYFKHMHKAGGTSFCHFIHGILQLKVDRFSNCNGNREIQKFVRGGQAELAMMHHKFQKQVYFNERALGSSQLYLERFAYVTAIRNPVGRQISHFMQTFLGSYKLNRDGIIRDLPILLRKWIEGKRPLRLRDKGFPFYVANMQSKELVGLSELTDEELLQRATERLGKFSLTVPMEQLQVGMRAFDILFCSDKTRKISQHCSRPMKNENTSRVVRARLLHAWKQEEYLLEKDPALYLTIYRSNDIDGILHQQSQTLFREQCRALCCFHGLPVDCLM